MITKSLPALKYHESMYKSALNVQRICPSERSISEAIQPSTNVRVFYWALDGRLESKHEPTAQHARLKNEKWVGHRQIIVIVFLFFTKHV